jgi:N-acetylglucosaminyl-diphospho-decaprenol L-rhamnosyltransferase
VELTIAINSYKNPDLLRLCLNSIKLNTTIEYELLVADSETKEETEMMMREDFPEVTFFPNRKNVGFQNLIKKGFEMSRGQYILFLNSDIIVTDGSVEKLLNFIKNDIGIGIAGPKLLNYNGTLQYSCFHFYKFITIIYRRTFINKFGFAKKHLDWFLMKDSDHEKTIEADWLMGSALIVRRDAIQKVGLMDHRFFMYMEDVDWCRRFWDSGFKVIYYPGSVMHHYHSRHSQGSRLSGIMSKFFNKYTWIHIHSAIRYFLKYWNQPLSHK